MPKNMDWITIIVTLKGIEKIKTKKQKQNSLKNISFTNALRKLLLNFDMLLTSYDYLIFTFHWFISGE